MVYNNLRKQNIMIDNSSQHVTPRIFIETFGPTVSEFVPVARGGHRVTRDRIHTSLLEMRTLWSKI